MISFIQFCEHETCKQKYSWFYMYNGDVSSFTEDELKQIHIEPSLDKDVVRVWYPRTKYWNRPINAEELKRILQHAIEREAWDEVKMIRERTK